MIILTPDLSLYNIVSSDSADPYIFFLIDLRDFLPSVSRESEGADYTLHQRVVADLESKCGNEAVYVDPDEERPTCPCVPPGLGRYQY